MAITAPTPIAALPAAPDPNDRATFNARAYPWAAAQAVMVAATNAVATNVFNNATEAKNSADAAATAIATTNYKGNWSSLTGALNMPASVSHAGTFWVLASNLANVTTATPGVSASWVPVIMGSIPQNSQSVAYTFVLTDAGKHILHPSADTTARIFTIPANASVSFPIGTVLTIINQASAGVVTLAITTDTMRWSPSGTTGSRNIAANGMATVVKITATEWFLSGMGLS